MHSTKYQKIIAWNGTGLTRRQWAQLFFARLLDDHEATVREYLDEIPHDEGQKVVDEMRAIAKKIRTRRGFVMVQEGKGNGSV